MHLVQALVSGALFLNIAAFAAAPDAVEVFDGETKPPLLVIWQDEMGRYHFKKSGNTLFALYPRQIGFFEAGGPKGLLKAYERLDARYTEMLKHLGEKEGQQKKLKTERDGLDEALAPVRAEISQETDPKRLERLQALLKTHQPRIDELTAKIDALAAELKTARDTEYSSGIPDIDALNKTFEETFAKSRRRVFPGDDEYTYFTDLVKNLSTHTALESTSYDAKADGPNPSGIYVHFHDRTKRSVSLYGGAGSRRLLPTFRLGKLLGD